MSLINWIFDIYQHNQINETRRDAEEARREVANLRSNGGGLDNERLVRAIEELALATKTMQRMMIQKGVCTSDEWERLLDEVDREDGRADGRTPLL